MSFVVHDTGFEFIAGLLAGSGGRINGMYVECDTQGEGPETVSRERLDEALDSGLKIARVAAVPLANGASVSFTAMVRRSDFGRLSDKSRITRATLVFMKDGIHRNDTVVATSEISPPVKVSRDAYTTVKIDMRLGNNG